MPSRRINVQTKVFGLGSLLLAFLVVLGVVALRDLSHVAKGANTTFAKATVPLNQLGEARALTNENHTLTNNHILEHDAAGRAQIQARIDGAAKRVTVLLGQIRPSLINPQADRQFAKLTSDITAYRAARAEVLKRSSDPAVSDVATYAYDKANAAPAVDRVNADFEALAASEIKAAKANDAAVTSTYHSLRTFVIALLLGAVLLGAGLAFLLGRSLRRNLDRVTTCLAGLRDVCAVELATGLGRMAEGDLTYDVAPTTALIDRWSNDEVGDVAQSANAIRNRFVEAIASYNASRGQLAQLVGEVSAAAGSVSAGSQQMASTSEETGRAVSEIAHAVGDVAEGAQRQVTTIEGARAAATEVTAVTEDSARTAQSTADAAEDAREIAAAGATAIGQATEAMAAVRDASEQATAAIRALGAKSDQIGGIVDTIGGIAEQTNLLALNAAIEAARAGDQGRGFAVVADEVRKLAEESQQAAGSIAALISEIQAETGRAIDVVESGGQRTNEGAATVEQAREAFQAIGASVEDVSARVTQIAAAIEEVAASASTMSDDMALVAQVAESSSAATEQVSAATQQTSASAQEIAASAQELARTAEQLEQLVGRFQLA